MAKAAKKVKETPITLSNDFTKLVEAYMRIEMMKNGMRTSYRHLLAPLAVKDGVTQLDLVKVTRLKAPTVSTTLRNMESDGLVTRETDKDDARATRVYLTDKGRDIDKKMRNSTAKIEKICLGEIPAEEIEACMATIHKLKENLEKTGGYSLGEF